MRATLDGMGRAGLLEEVTYKLRNEEPGLQCDKSQGKSNPGKAQATVLAPRVNNRTDAQRAQ